MFARAEIERTRRGSTAVEQVYNSAVRILPWRIPTSCIKEVGFRPLIARGGNFKVRICSARIQRRQFERKSLSLRLHGIARELWVCNRIQGSLGGY